VLANRERLTMLRELFVRPDQAVTEMAVRRNVSCPAASKYLRELNARGLLEARRIAGWVRYRPRADPSVPHAGPLLAALEAAFGDRGNPVDFIFRQVTGFTHPRRLSIVAALGREPIGLVDLSRRTRICCRALSRHLKKLTDRGFVRGTRGRYSLAKPRSPLAGLLLRLARMPEH
jgi:DNA-binding MarR family transcriptional regulator